MNPHKERELGERVAGFLLSDEWIGAFQGYRLFILAEIEREDDEKRVMALKAHLKAAQAVRLHLESLIKSGAIAAEQIKIEERRGLRRFLP